jgi:iron complex outermembrane recepter protein
MKKTIFTLLCLFSISAMFAQTDISGTVKDNTGVPIPGANILIVGSTSGATSDFDGNFNFTTSVTGAQKLQISYLGYATKEQTVTLSGSAIKLQIVLEEGGNTLDEVLLTATSSKRSQKETPMSITSFGAKQLSQANTSSQADILKSVPGITTENGGGEVASNVFVRGLPSGGQFQFNPLQIDGMPVLSTFGLNSSAHDVYFRSDIGMKSLEFVRGGSSVLYGVGSVAGIINYTSETGSATPKNILKIETGSYSHNKAQFLTSGPLGNEDSSLFYALSGSYRYDEGPIDTGIPTEGYQFRGNIKKVTKNGSITVSGQYIDDQVQFFLPYALEGGTRNRPTGNNGKEIMTLQTAAASRISYKTPDGIYHSPIEDGVSTKGGYVMVNFIHNFNDDLKLDAKIRNSKYAHQFNLFLDGHGIGGAKVVETQAEYLAARGLASGTFTSLNGGATLPANALLFENRILDRDRPISELVTEIKLTKTAGNHTITGGTFMSRSEAGDFNVISSYLSEYNNSPDLVNLSGYTINGITNRGAGYTNKDITSNKTAIFLTDEIKLDNWNFDIGLRYETVKGRILNEKSSSQLVDNTGIAKLDNVTWGTGEYQIGEVSADDIAIALAALYKVNDNLSVYGNVSSGYFFPELRGVKFDASNNTSSYKPERINQAEVGLKYGNGKFSGTFATYLVALKDRISVNFINNPNGPGLIEEARIFNTKSIGIEATANYKISDAFAVNGSITIQDHEVTKSESNPGLVGNALVRQPKFLNKLGLAYEKSSFDSNLDFNYAGKKYANDANTIELDGYGVFDFNMGYTFNVGENDETLRVGFQSFNIFNSEGITEGSPRLGDNQTDEQFFVGRPIIPRTYLLSATFKF